MHIDGLNELPVRLAMIPVMRGRQDPVYPEVVRQALPEITDGLNVVVWPVYTRVAMAEIYIRHDECAVLVQEPRYLGELLGLEVARILEETLGQDDVESLVAEPDGTFKKVTLHQIGRRLMYDYVDAMVLDIGRNQAHQGRGAAANIKESALPAAGEPVDDPRRFFETIVRLAVCQALLAPEVLLVVARRAVGTTLRSDATVTGRPVNDLPSVAHEFLPRRLADVDTTMLCHTVPVVGLVRPVVAWGRPWPKTAGNRDRASRELADGQYSGNPVPAIKMWRLQE
jgi:hypothetical protein